MEVAVRGVLSRSAASLETNQITLTLPESGQRFRLVQGMTDREHEAYLSLWGLLERGHQLIALHGYLRRASGTTLALGVLGHRALDRPSSVRARY